MIIEDIASEIVLPNIRGILAHVLRNRGLSQHRIAKILNITQPLVHKLLSKPVEHYVENLKKYSIDEEIVLHQCRILADLAVSENFARFVITSHGFTSYLSAIIACKEFTELREECVKGLLKDPYIEVYKTALSRIMSKPGLARILPEVGSNLVYAPEPPTSEADIIGLTGRIVKTLTGIVVTGEPFYGGSRHLAKLLLLIVRHNPMKKVGFNFKYDYSLVTRLKHHIYHVVYTGPHTDLSGFWKTMEDVAGRKPDVIVDKGGTGLEPVTYVFTKDFYELESILEILL
ncbi:Fis family transcriptional regulator [Thermosphaera chiliense]|uniref:Fis family transcriptional regulator n=1 Tax=Thermosphaera chiliense TaxID=3402707 RepID=A0A7M1UNQ7_9CREN|nr:thiamine-phosphate synthase family protein [Thermosphaera aggregans]QOR93898.1 Fis family transcriptional regulator [Thermosphaera aggregans]